MKNVPWDENKSSHGISSHGMIAQNRPMGRKKIVPRNRRNRVLVMVPVRAAITRWGVITGTELFCYVVFAVFVCFFLSVLLFVLCLFLQVSL